MHYFLNGSNKAEPSSTQDKREKKKPGMLLDVHDHLVSTLTTGGLPRGHQKITIAYNGNPYVYEALKWRVLQCILGP